MSNLEQGKLEQLRRSLKALEQQRSVLGVEVVETALDVLKKEIKALEAEEAPAPEIKEERRIITILFTDIVGSTSIAEKLDPEDWREMLKKVHRSAGDFVHQWDGEVLQHLGDGILAVFGAKVSRERDSENAVRAALDIQAALPGLPIAPPLQMRVGVHTGLVVTGELGSVTKREFAATGDAMNHADRLQKASPVGGVLISDDTYRYVRGLFDLSLQPPIKVKGKQEPIQTYLVLRAKTRPFRMVTRGVGGVKTRTIGRETEMQKISEAFRDCLDQRSVAWAQLVGEPGVGKTRLLMDLAERLEAFPAFLTWFRACAFDGDNKQPYALIRRMWFDRFEIAEDMPVQEIERLWVKGFHDLQISNFEESAHVLGLLMGLNFPDSPYLGALREDPVQAKGRAFVVSRELLDLCREQNPLVILLEDLQWADRSSWEYIDHVLLNDARQQAHTQGLFILANARPEWDPPTDLLNLEHYTQLDLHPLSDEASTFLARELLQRVVDLPEHVVEHIVERSEGVPYFAEEIVNWYLDQGVIDHRSDPWRFVATRYDETPLPMTLHHLLSTRLGALGEDQRKTLQSGAVFGRRFWNGGLEHLGLSSDETLLEGLQQRGYIEALPASSFEGQPEWRFHHNLMRDVAYESILKRERIGLHKRAGGWIEIQARRVDRVDEFLGTLGLHAERARMLDHAVHWYQRAGNRALSQSAFIEADQFFDRALALVPEEDRERRWLVLLDRVQGVSVLGDSALRDQITFDLLALANESEEVAKLAEAYYRRGSYFESMGDSPSALIAIRKSLEFATDTENMSLYFRVLAMAIVCHTRLGQYEEAESRIEEALGNIEAMEDESDQARVITNAAVYFTEVGDLSQAAKMYRDQVEITHRLGNKDGEAIGLMGLAYINMQLGMYERACDQLETSLLLNEAIGARRQRAYVLLNLVLANWRRGDYQYAQGLLMQTMPEFEALGDVFGLGVGFSYAGLCLELAGDHAEARKAFSKAHEILMEANLQTFAQDSLAGLARCQLAQGEEEGAYRTAERVWEYLQKGGGKGLELPINAYLTCAKVFEKLSETDKAAAVIEAGYRELIEQATKISDADWCTSYLDNVPEHREIQDLWDQSVG